MCVGDERGEKITERALALSFNLETFRVHDAEGAT